MKNKFPVVETIFPEKITMLAYFAGQVLAGLYANEESLKQLAASGDAGKLISKQCFGQAILMLEAHDEALKELEDKK